MKKIYVEENDWSDYIIQEGRTTLVVTYISRVQGEITALKLSVPKGDYPCLDMDELIMSGYFLVPRGREIAAEVREKWENKRVNNEKSNVRCVDRGQVVR